MKTVRELKEFIKDLPDEMLLLAVSDIFELKGNIVDEVRVCVDKYGG